LGVSSAQAQYMTVPPVVSGSATVLPYGGYYGPAFTTGPSISFGAPSYSQLLGEGYGSYGAEVGPDAYGYGGYGGYGMNGYGGYDGNDYNPFAYTGVGDFTNRQPGDRTVNPTEVQGGIEEVNPNAPATGELDGQAAPDINAVPAAPNAARNRRASNPIVVRRAPYNRLYMAYRGNTANVNSITMMVLDKKGRALQQDALTSPPAETQLRVPVGARYYRVVVTYNDGTSRTYTHRLNVQQSR
jgi:hypothetical protein